jgi:hypothetical protein
MADPTAVDLITFERSWIGRGKYVKGTSGRAIKNSGRLEFDCVGFQEYCLRETGLWAKFFPGVVKRPTTVYEFQRNFHGKKDKISSAVGDFLIFGNPTSRDYHLVYAHVGLLTHPNGKIGTYISMYDPKNGIIEKRLDEVPWMRPVLCLHTGLS